MGSRLIGSTAMTVAIRQQRGRAKAKAQRASLSVLPRRAACKTTGAALDLPALDAETIATRTFDSVPASERGSCRT